MLKPSEFALLGAHHIEAMLSTGPYIAAFVATHGIDRIMT